MDFNFLIEDRLRSVAPRVNCPSIGRLSAAGAPIVSAHDEIVAGSDGRFKYGAPATLRTRCSHQASVDCNSSDDQAEDDCREQQQPAPILARLAQSAYEMSAIVIGDNCDDSITLRGNRRAKGRYSIDGLSVMLLAIAPRIILLHEIDPPSHRIRNHRHPAFHRLGTGTGSRPAATA